MFINTITKFNNEFNCKICSVVQNTLSGMYSIVFELQSIKVFEKRAIFLLQTNDEDILVNELTEKSLQYYIGSKSTITKIYNGSELIVFYTDANISKDSKEIVNAAYDSCRIITDHQHFLLLAGNYDLVDNGARINYGTKQCPEIDVFEVNLKDPLLSYHLLSTLYIYKLKSHFKVISTHKEAADS